MIRVTQFFRSARAGGYSIERLYEDVRVHLPADFLVSVYHARFLSKGFWPRLFDALLARRYQGDVNHVTGDVHFMTYFLCKRRTLLTIHDCAGLDRLRGVRRRILWLFWFWLAEKRCAAIVAVSEATKKQLLRHLRCDPDKIRVIYNCVSPEFSAMPKEFNSACPRILQIGTKENKNLERLVRAVEGLSCKLVIIGKLTDSQRSTLKRCKVDFEEHVGLSREALLDQYRRCDLLALVSTYEGFGLPIIEANAVGRPVVTSNLLSMPEVAGGSACLVDPFDVADILRGILRVVEDASYRNRLIEAGFKNVKRFRADVIARQYAELYREIADAAAGQMVGET